MAFFTALPFHSSRTRAAWAFCDPAGARTQDPNIKSVVLYQLSYRIGFRAANIRSFGLR
jgi:hypothetical protein